MKGFIAPVQHAVVAKLTEKLPSRSVWADVPEDTTYPYLVVAGVYGSRQPVKNANIYDLTVEVAAEWREQGTSLYDAGVLIDEAVQALTGQDQHGDQLASLQVVGFDVVGLQFTEVDPPERDTEADRARIVARFRLQIQEQ